MTRQLVTNQQPSNTIPGGINMNTSTTNNIIDRQGPVPSRATTSISLTAGSMVFPLSIYTAVSELAVNRSERLGGDPAVSVGRVSIRKDTGAIVESTNVTRMAEAVAGKAAGSWVVVSDADLIEVYGETGEAEVVSFVPVADAGRYVTDGLLQVRAKSDKRASAQAANESAFSLLLTGMGDRQVHALVRVVMRGGPRFGLLTADGDMLTIIPAEAVRAARPLVLADHDDKAVKMMGQFIDAIGVGAGPVNDDTPDRVQSFIDSKAEASGVAAGASPTVTSQGGAPVMVDVMAALQESITKTKASRSTPAKKAPVKKKAAAKKTVPRKKAVSK
jgi:non-homologous end joining protein Ku